MLYLFDIDGTLVDTGGAGMKSLQEASRELFGSDGPDLDLAGSTDLGIVAQIHSHFGIEDTPDRFQQYFDTYLVRLERNLATGEFPCQVLDGVRDILDTIAGTPGTHIGLLTGNTAGGAATKMRHFGLDHYFAFGAYGCDHADRNLLGPVALARAAAHASREFSPGETWIIGDTPKDIACAHAFGARCLAVATGRYREDELSAHGADAVISTMRQALSHLL